MRHAAKSSLELGVFLTGLVVLGVVLLAAALYFAFGDHTPQPLRFAALVAGVPLASGSLYRGLGGFYVLLRTGNRA